LLRGIEPLIKRISQKMFQQPSVKMIGTLDDVQQVGRLGALDAARKFQPERGHKFATYAASRIKGQIIDAARQSALVRVPRLVTTRREEVRYCQTIGSFQAPADGEDAEAMARHNLQPREEAPALTDAAAAVERFHRSLSDRERMLVGLYYGLDDQPPMTMREIGRSLGLSESRVSQMLSQLLKRARQVPYLQSVVRGLAKSPKSKVQSHARSTSDFGPATFDGEEDR
jgi:RNA polymerase sigma factor FliA